MFRNIDERVGYHIGVAAHFIQNNYNQKLAEYELTVAQGKVLYMLVNFGDQLQAQLQQRLYIKASTMNGIIDSMLKKQLIEKNDSATDRRSKIISLTKKGRLLEDKLWLGSQHVEGEIIEGLSPEDKQLLLSLLKRVTKNLQESQFIDKERNA